MRTAKTFLKVQHRKLVARLLIAMVLLWTHLFFSLRKNCRGTCFKPNTYYYYLSIWNLHISRDWKKNFFSRQQLSFPFLLRTRGVIWSPCSESKKDLISYEVDELIGLWKTGVSTVFFRSDYIFVSFSLEKEFPSFFSVSNSNALYKTFCKSISI